MGDDILATWDMSFHGTEGFVGIFLFLNQDRQGFI